MKNFTNYPYLFFLAFALVNITIIPSNGQALDKFLDKVEKASDNLDKTLNSVDKLLNNLDKSTDKNNNKKTINNDKKEKEQKIVSNKKNGRDEKASSNENNNDTDIKKKQSIDGELKPLFLNSETWRGLGGRYECEFSKISMQYFEYLKLEIYENFPVRGGVSIDKKAFRIKEGVAKGNEISFEIDPIIEKKIKHLSFKGSFFESNNYYVIIGDCEEIQRYGTTKTVVKSGKLTLKLKKIDDKTNVYYSGINENEYFSKILKHFGNFYSTQTSYNETDVKISINKRDVKGFPTLITGSYLRMDNNTQNRIVVEFKEGIPFRATYPDIGFNDGVSGNGEGKTGVLAFSTSNRNKIDKFYSSDRIEFNKIENQEKLLNEVIKIQSSYGNFDCSKCLVGIKDNSSTKYGETIYDEKNRPIGVEEKSTGTIYGIKYTNKCNQTITVCAIRKTMENSNSKIYYDDVSIVFKPYEVKIEQQSILMSGFFGQKVEDYFNLNPNYSVKSAKTNEIEYIKIVGKQKPKL